jgi:hypothetical protein
MQILTAFDTGKVTRLADGRVQREYTVTAFDREIEVAKGVKFPAWTFNGSVPGPTIRCTEGDRLIIHFGTRPTPPSIHESTRPATAFEVVPPAATLRAHAELFGLFCTTARDTLKKHIPRFWRSNQTKAPPAKELVMVIIARCGREKTVLPGTARQLLPSIRFRPGGSWCGSCGEPRVRS